MARRIDALYENNHRPAYDRREDVNRSDVYGRFCERFINMLSKFEPMWDGRLGRVVTAKHRIGLNEPLRLLVYSTSYRETPRTRKSKKIEIDKMLADNITEPTGSE